MTTKRLVIIGAGGYAREVAWYIDNINRVDPVYQFVGFVVSDVSRLGPHDSVDRVLGDYDWLASHRREVDVLGLGIGTPGNRLKVAAELEAAFPELEWPTIVHPSARFDSSASLGAGAILGAGVVGTVNLVIEPFALINLTCTLGHEARIGRGSVLNPGVNLSGGVTIEEGVLVGTGAVVLQYLSIGAHATVGAGSVVTKDVKPGITVVGIPARPLVKGTNVSRVDG